MHEFNREEITQDQMLKQLGSIITKNHQIPEHTRKNLLENKHIKDFCEESRHFALLKKSGGKDLHIHYDVSSWFFPPNGVTIQLQTIGIYEDFLEYEIARQKGLNSTPHSFSPNQN